jgi:hypothetical protein
LELEERFALSNKHCRQCRVWLGLMLVIGGIVSIFMGNVIGGLWWFMIGLFVRSAAQRSYQQLLARNLFHPEKRMELNDFEKKDLRSEKS